MKKTSVPIDFEECNNSNSNTLKSCLRNPTKLLCSTQFSCYANVHSTVPSDHLSINQISIAPLFPQSIISSIASPCHQPPHKTTPVLSLPPRTPSNPFSNCFCFVSENENINNKKHKCHNLNTSSLTKLNNNNKVYSNNKLNQSVCMNCKQDTKLNVNCWVDKKREKHTVILNRYSESLNGKDNINSKVISSDTNMKSLNKIKTKKENNKNSCCSADRSGLLLNSEESINVHDDHKHLDEEETVSDGRGCEHVVSASCSCNAENMNNYETNEDRISKEKLDRCIRSPSMNCEHVVIPPCTHQQLSDNVSLRSLYSSQQQSTHRNNKKRSNNTIFKKVSTFCCYKKRNKTRLRVTNGSNVNCYAHTREHYNNLQNAKHEKLKVKYC